MEKKDDRKNMRNRLLCAGQNCRKMTSWQIWWIRMTPGFASGRELQEDILQRMRRLRIWRQRRRKRALAQSDIPAEDVDLILVATSTPENVFPCTACEVQREIHAEHAAGFDLNAACSGFLLRFRLHRRTFRQEFTGQCW